MSGQYGVLSDGQDSGSDLGVSLMPNFERCRREHYLRMDEQVRLGEAQGPGDSLLPYHEVLFAEREFWESVERLDEIVIRVHATGVAIRRQIGRADSVECCYLNRRELHPSRPQLELLL